MTLITPEYLAQQRTLHASPKGYGGKGAKWAEHVTRLATQLGARQVLDYGCGQGSLARALAANAVRGVAEYDPAIPGKDRRPPIAYDLVVCTDVLEHIEPDCLDAVLDDLARLTLGHAFIVVSLVPAGKLLSDGRNAHLILQPAAWWTEQLARRFDLVEIGPVREPKGYKEFAALWQAR